MFGKLKESITSHGADTLANKLAPELENQLQAQISQVTPDVVFEDHSFHKYVVDPLRIAVSACISGADKLIPNFDEKFGIALLHIRDELIERQENQVAMVENYKEQLPDVLKSGFAKAQAM